MEEKTFHTFPSTARLIKVVFKDFENCEGPWDVDETSMILFPGMLNVFQVLFMVKLLFKNKTERIPEFG